VRLDNAPARTAPTSLWIRANPPVHVGRSVHVLPESALVKIAPTRLLRRGNPARKSALIHTSSKANEAVAEKYVHAHLVNALVARAVLI